MHRKGTWILSLLLVALIGLGLAVVADEGVHRTWITIGDPGYVPTETCDACWDQMVALDLAQHYSRLTVMWSSECVDWNAFQTQVLPAVAQALAAEADRFAAMIDTIFEMRALMEQAGTLALWEQTAASIAGWPSFPPEFPWPWPWPNCIFFSYALSAGGIAESAAEQIVSQGSFGGLVDTDPAALGAVIAEAILDAADLVSSTASRGAMERIATNVVPELLPRLAADPWLLSASQAMLDDWGNDSDSPEVPSVLIPVDDPFDSKQYEIRDWMDYVQAAAAVIGAAAAVAGLCM